MNYSWVIATKGNKKIRLQALSLVNKCYTYKMYLITNGVVNDNAKFVECNKVSCSNKTPIGDAEPISIGTKEKTVVLWHKLYILIMCIIVCNFNLNNKGRMMESPLVSFEQWPLRI